MLSIFIDTPNNIYSFELDYELQVLIYLSNKGNIGSILKFV